MNRIVTKSLCLVVCGRVGKLRFVNLLPNYADFPTSYEDYVLDFVETVKPDVLCVDHYPQFFPGSETSAANTTMAGYIRNLVVLRDVALANGLHFMNFFNIMPFNGYFDVSEAEIRWQVGRRVWKENLGLPTATNSNSNKRQPLIAVLVRVSLQVYTSLALGSRGVL